MYAIKAARPPGLAAFAFDARRSARELPLPSCRFASSHTPPFVAMRHLPPERGKSSLKGTAFGGGGKVSGIAQRRPLGGAGCERSEQTEGVPAARLFPQETSAVAAVSLHDPTRENAFGALRRARQTLYIKRSFRYLCPERKRRAFLIFPLSRWTLKCVILGENDAHRRDDHAI